MRAGFYKQNLVHVLKTKYQRNSQKYNLLLVLIAAFGALHLLLSSLFKNPDKTDSIIIERNTPRRSNIERHITEDGIFPLPERILLLKKWNKGSVIPKKYFRNIPNVSAHNYEWILNPFRTCFSSHKGNVIRDEAEKVFLLVTIASASWNFERRNVIRQTWASHQQFYNKEIRYVFFFGDGRSSKENLYREFIKHGDTVLQSYKESYKNLTLKTQGQLKWATYFCPNARYVMHVDDDVFVDVKQVIDQLLSIQEERLLFCGKIFMPKVRREGKWATTLEEYQGSRYPKSCVGWCFVMTQLVANEIYFTSINTILFHLEDVTFTGIIREKIKNLEVTRLSNGNEICKHMGWPKDRPTNEKLLQAWKELKLED